jgi:hypothetical protein
VNSGQIVFNHCRIGKDAPDGYRRSHAGKYGEHGIERDPGRDQPKVALIKRPPHRHRQPGQQARYPMVVFR